MKVIFRYKKKVLCSYPAQCGVVEFTFMNGNSFRQTPTEKDLNYEATFDVENLVSYEGMSPFKGMIPAEIKQTLDKHFGGGL